MLYSAGSPAPGALDQTTLCEVGRSREAPTSYPESSGPRGPRPFYSSLFTCQCTDWLCVAGAASREAACSQ